ncbi:unnamed protein product [Heterobilharzia americana]|nr:unnamed protein product [Heterobilharzia americana]
MSLRHLSPRNKQSQMNSLSSERDYNYHMKHSKNFTNLLDKSYKNSTSKYHSYLSQNKLLNSSKGTDSKNQAFLKYQTSKSDIFTFDNYSTFSIPSKLRSIYNYGGNTLTNNPIHNSNNKEVQQQELLNFKSHQSESTYSCHSPIIHVRSNIRNDGFSFLKHLNKPRKYSHARNYNAVNNSYDDMIHLNNKLNENSIRSNNNMSVSC